MEKGITMVTHKYKINDRVVFRHLAVGSMTGRVTKLTWYPVNNYQQPRATYTVLGDDKVIYPLLGIDKESSVGNICTEDTNAGRVIVRQSEVDVIYTAPKVCPFIRYSLKELQEKCKSMSIPYYGSKKDLINRIKQQTN